MYKIAVIGKQSDVLGFMALGFRVETVSDAAGAASRLKALAASREYAVIFVAEDFVAELEPEIRRYTDDLIPAVVPIPTSGADGGYGMNAISEAVIRAVGADIK
jgi:V/A-type H+-transporting ATPase subunit F